MARILRSLAIFTPLLLSACAVAPPTGPSVMALPGKGKDFAQFQQDDASCRQYASSQVGGVAPEQAASQSFANSAALGTVLGAAAGAAIGAATGNPAAGAAIGAGSGLFLGGATGIDAAGYSEASLQRRYDVGYIQCMSAMGESVPATTSGVPAYGYYSYPYYGAYPYPYAYPYAYPYPYGYPWYWGAPVGVGASFIFFHGHHHGHFGGSHRAMAHR